MSRRNRAQRKIAVADPIYNSRLVTLLISRILKSGKKSLAQRIVYNALEIISKKTGAEDRSDSKFAPYTRIFRSVIFQCFCFGCISAKHQSILQPVIFGT